MTIEEIIKGNAGLIYKIASKFYGMDKEDLYQAGVLGLLKAYKNYRKEGTTKFSTYAYDYIYGEMYLLVNNRNLKINKDIIKLSKLIEKTKYQLAQRLNHIPSDDELSEFLEIPKERISEALLAGKEIMSLDNDENYSLYETIRTPESNNIDDQILINESLNELTNDEKTIIRERYYNDLTQSEIARKLCMTQVMVSRYEKKGLNKMQEFMIR